MKRMNASIIPEIDYVIKTENGETGEDNKHSNEANEEDESSFRFKDGHLETWWLLWKELPEATRPVFCPAMGFGDVFQQFQESAIVALLWGQGKNHPTRPFMEAKLCTHAKAKETSEKDYGALLHLLFVGEAESIKAHPKKKQTSYGRRTTTMSQLAHMAPDVFGVKPMQDYVNDWFGYVRQRKDSDGASTAQLTPPHLPTAPHPTRLRYATSNYLQTDGLRANVVGFDTRNRYVPKGWNVIVPRIEKRFPNRPSINAALGPNPYKVVVVGIDPGEIITASLCGLDPDALFAATNLHIRRAALYAPSLSHREALQELKRQRPVVTQSSTIDSTLWSGLDPHRYRQATAEEFELPSISEIESSLPSKAFVSIEQHEKATQQWWYSREALSGFYSSTKIKRWNWEKHKATQAEKEWAFNGALRVADPSAGPHGGPTKPILFVYGDANFRTYRKLPSKHSAFMRYFYQKARGLGYHVVRGDEYLTSTMCPTCVSRNHPARLAKPTRRSCVCVEPGCQRWINRDSVGSHNLAIIGQKWIRELTRPVPLRRPSLE